MFKGLKIVIEPTTCEIFKSLANVKRLRDAYKPVFIQVIIFQLQPNKSIKLGNTY